MPNIKTHMWDVQIFDYNDNNNKIKKNKKRWTRVLTYLAISRVMLERINHPLKIVYLMIEKI
jgi:hypothetical protein